MGRRSVRSMLATGLLLGSLLGCSSASEPIVDAAPSPQASGPGSTWLAVLASAADPNDLDAPRADVVAALGSDDGSQVLVSPGGCFTGIPRRFGPVYVLALSGETRSQVEGWVERVGTDPEWVGTVTATCLD
jgi:hypothetical protein